MNDSDARDIVQALADGIDPVTGEQLPQADRWREQQVDWALRIAADHLEALAERTARILKDHPRAGQLWSPEEDDRLVHEYRRGLSVEEMAEKHQRTRGAIRSHLMRHVLPDPLPVPERPAVPGALAPAWIWDKLDDRTV
jgi:hypothetical protein